MPAEAWAPRSTRARPRCPRPSHRPWPPQRHRRAASTMSRSGRRRAAARTHSSPALRVSTIESITACALPTTISSTSWTTQMRSPWLPLDASAASTVPDDAPETRMFARVTTQASRNCAIGRESDRVADELLERRLDAATLADREHVGAGGGRRDRDERRAREAALDDRLARTPRDRRSAERDER